MIGAILFPMDDITDFLYLIGSVFAPMIAVQISDYFILRKESVKESIHTKNLLIWLAGFIIYRILLRMDLALGSTVSCIILVIVIKVIVEKFVNK